ncbi:hypothetical protein G7K_5404-t1 [Saitoella complicata NRRL Y-17804]|uniref:Uncharacterized protein n=1 Tax=Saitoella complicata (strain BCRC 22490 / CBS 7301 / JCM 7358 / NBRC 10748 / NRRL Y-17804) TaxID=698492 RepID=A0A0E9NN84_SAICN|nr:hypothetical protein G7K_5404-t1 [Saitoella complicata NRRL Y-17804]
MVDPCYAHLLRAPGRLHSTHNPCNNDLNRYPHQQQRPRPPSTHGSSLQQRLESTATNARLRTPSTHGFSIHDNDPNVLRSPRQSYSPAPNFSIVKGVIDLELLLRLRKDLSTTCVPLRSEPLDTVLLSSNIRTM